MGRQVSHYHLIKQKNDLGTWEVDSLMQAIAIVKEARI